MTTKPALLTTTAAAPADYGLPALAALAYPIEAIPAATGIKRDKLFDAIRDKKLTARKSGRNTIVEAVELLRYLRSLPSKGRDPAGDSVAA